MNTMIPTGLVPIVAPAPVSEEPGIVEGPPLMEEGADLSRSDFLRIAVAGTVGLAFAAAPRTSSAAQAGNGNVLAPASSPLAQNRPPQKELSRTAIVGIMLASALPIALPVLYFIFNTQTRMGRRSLANAEKAVEFAQMALSHQGTERERFYSLSHKFANRIDPHLFKEYLDACDCHKLWGLRGDEIRILKPFYDPAVKLVEELHSLWNTYLKSLPEIACVAEERMALTKFFKRVLMPDLSVIHAIEAMPQETDEGSAVRDLHLLGALHDVISSCRGGYPGLPEVFKSWLASDGAHKYLMRFLGRRAASYKEGFSSDPVSEKLVGLISGAMFNAALTEEGAPQNLLRFEKYAELIERNFAEHDPIFWELVARVWESVLGLARKANVPTDRLIQIRGRIIEYHRRYLPTHHAWQRDASYAAIAEELHAIAALRARSENPDHNLASEAYEAASRGWADAKRWTKVIEDLCEAARHAELAGDRQRASRLRLSAVLDAKDIGKVNWTWAFGRISRGEGERRRTKAPLAPQIDTTRFEDIPVAVHTGPRPIVLAGSMGEPRVAYRYNHHQYEPLQPNPALMRSLYEWPVFGGDLFAPPAEKQPYVLRLVLTKGCDYSACTFCSGYAGVPPVTLSGDEFRQHVDGVFEFLSRSADLRTLDLRRVFIGSGDVMGVPFDELYEALRYTQNAFSSATGRTRADRVSIYATTRSILKKTPAELGQLRQFLDLVYWGVESGSDEVLKYVKKGTSHGQMAEAAARLNEVGIGISAMIMTGLGGVKFSDEHVVESARLLTRIGPKFITFMGVNAGPDTLYARTMNEERARRENRPLSPRESTLQLADMIDRTALSPRARAGSFPPDVDCVGRNAAPFPNTDMDNLRRENLVASLRLRSGILAATQQTIAPAAVQTLADFVADEDQNILIRLYAAELLGLFGEWAETALPLLRKFGEDYSAGKIEAVSWAVREIEDAVKKARTARPDNVVLAAAIRKYLVESRRFPSEAYSWSGVDWLGDFLRDLLGKM